MRAAFCSVIPLQCTTLPYSTTVPASNIFLMDTSGVGMQSLILRAHMIGCSPIIHSFRSAREV